MKAKNIFLIAIVTILLLMVPLVAMQFTPEVSWSFFDFIVAGFLIFSTGLAYEFIARKGGNTAYRVAAGIAIGTAFLLIWMNLAVGLVGSGPNLPNVLYMAVPVVGIIVAAMSRYRAEGMTRALLATALAQVLLPGISLLIIKLQTPSNETSPDMLDILGLTAFFVMLWTVSALLFRRAAHSQSNMA